ncbi:hypothetical protein ACFYW9_24175 [Streptomyces sp. NPDC002698]|uniref:hypothetical protein n=1 Tax=Streptomyces sp. NPDC002698 TaxID=3364660 RepID=UPI0036A6A245
MATPHPIGLSGGEDADAVSEQFQSEDEAQDRHHGDNLLLSSYWTMGAVRHGDYITKVRITPDPPFAAAVVRRDLDPASGLEKMDALSFTPWRVTAEHAPLGNIMRARKEVNRRSSVERHRLNQQPRTESRSSDEVLGPTQ